MNQIIITIPEFITHVAKTNNKVALNKYMKINNQSIYNGAITRFTRATVVNNLHDYLSLYMQTYKNLNISTSVEVTYKIYTVINHGSISMRNGVICYKPPTKSYIPTWDIENLSAIWGKVGNDALVLNNVIKDDNVGIIKKISYEFVEVQNLTDRKIEIIINY